MRSYIIFVLLGLTSCGTSSENSSLYLNEFQDCDAVKNYLKTAASRTGSASGELTTPNADTRTAAAAQEEGDIVKLSGNYLIKASGGVIHIVDVSNPSQLRLLKKVEFQSGEYVQEILVRDQKVIAFVSGGHVVVDSSQPESQRNYYSTRIQEIALSANPTLGKSVLMTSFFHEARMDDQGRISVISTEYPNLFDYTRPSRPIPLPAVDMLENALGKSYDVETQSSQQLCNCDTMYSVRDPRNLYGSVTFTRVHQLDTSMKLKDQISFVGASGFLRATDQSFLFAFNADSIAFADISNRDVLIDPRAADKSMVLVAKQKGNKLGVVAKTEVSGGIISQFAMDLRSDVLNIFSQVAGTENSRRSTQLESFELKNNTLTSINKISGLGEDERLYSALFGDNRAYAVTFREAVWWGDPLFVFDMTNPRAPIKTGELEISGFSSQLVELADGRLIGIGEEVRPSDGRRLGLKISLFSFSSAGVPQETDREIFRSGQTWSDATASQAYGYKSFMLDEGTQTIAVPSNEWVQTGNNFQNVAWLSFIGWNGTELSIRAEKSFPNEIIERVLKVGNSYVAVSEGKIHALNAANPSQELSSLVLP